MLHLLLEHVVLLGTFGAAHRDYFIEDIIGGPNSTTFLPKSFEYVSMATYNPVDGFIVCQQDCYRWKEPASTWSQMEISVPHYADASTQINLSDGRIWNLGGRASSLSTSKLKKCFI